MVEYKWNVIRNKTQSVQINGQDDKLVIEIEFSVIGYKGNQNTFIMDTIQIPNNSSELIPYLDLNEEILIDWVHSFLGETNINLIKEDIESRLNEMIEFFNQRSLQTIPTEYSLVPWADLNVSGSE